MNYSIKYKINGLKKTLRNLIIKNYLLKKKLRNIIVASEFKNNKKIIKNKNFYKNRPQHIEWVKKHNSFIKRRYFGHLGWFYRRFILKPLKRKKIKRFKRLNWSHKNNITTIFYRVSKPSFTKVIKSKNDLKSFSIYKNNDVKINKNFKLVNHI